MTLKSVSTGLTTLVFSFALLALNSGCEVKSTTPTAESDLESGSTTGSGAETPSDGASDNGQKRVLIDGSSTVYPISQAVAEEFQASHPNVKVVVGTSGTGGGFKKFIAGETDINDASRPIKEKEAAHCKDNGIEYIELKVAIDGISVVVNPENDWCKALTVAQLKKLWEPGSTVTKWSELDPSWPAEEIRLFGPDTDSGTFDYFTDVICGEEGASRTGYTPSTDDNVLVRGVSGEKYSLGYFGFAYYLENAAKLRAVPVSATEDVADAVAPTPETIEGGTYTPLSRPLFLYVNKAKLARPELAEFLTYYLEKGQDLVGEVGYVRLGQETHAETAQTLKQAIGE
ncbi:MAG: PstS family phosphate ABC transporter substrate-binding protein [Rhodopirellula sp.]|nr:PstS family phosphate ABC transporter substrate-binding protein [Rhodopirellula sp.]